VKTTTGHIDGHDDVMLRFPWCPDLEGVLMISVFGSFILNGDPTIKRFGVGLSVAVLLASTMVLSLAPAMLTLFGRAVWWLPGWLSRLLPHVDIEGGPEPPTPAPAVAPHPDPRQGAAGPSSIS
jgi:hypothetical protein